MYPAAPITGSADEITVDGTSRQFSAITAMAAGQYFLFVSSTDCWIKQGSAPVASAAAGSMFVPARTPIFINGQLGAKLASIQDSGAGKATLCPVQL